VVFGEEDDFFNRFAGMAAVSPALPLIGGGATRFQPVYAGDVGAAIAAALSRPEATGIFELGGPGVYSFRELMELMLRGVQRRRLLLPVPFPAALALGRIGDLMARAGLKPPVTRDQVELLKHDNVALEDGLLRLGVEATALEAILPTYLWKYRNGGQFAAPDR
jgi:NADH dehydrogenase